MKSLLTFFLIGSVTLVSFTWFKNEGTIHVDGVTLVDLSRTAPPAPPAAPSTPPTQVNITVNPPPLPQTPPPPAAASQPQSVDGTGALDCAEARSDYECRRIALMLAERELAEKVAQVLSASSTLSSDGQGGHYTHEMLSKRSEAVLRNREIVSEGLENGRYTYHLRARVEAF